MFNISGKLGTVGPLTQRRRFLPARGSFSANVLTLMTGVTLAQGLVVATAPILTRLYSPEDFGVYALFLSLTGILSAVVSGRYEFAIILPAEDRDAANILALTGVIVLAMSGMLVLAVALGRHTLAALLKAPELASWLWWAPLCVFLTGTYQALNYWGNRKKQFQRLALSRGGQAAGTVAIQMGGGLLGMAGPGGLIAGTLAGQLLGTAMLSRTAGQAWAIGSISPGEMGRLAWVYRRFPLYDSWGGLANLGAYQLPPIFLNFFFGAATAGFFSLGFRLLNLPISLINASFSQVFFQKYHESRETPDRQAFLWRTIKFLATIAFFPAVILFFLAPWLFQIFFGHEWVAAGEYVRILTPLLFFRFIASSISNVLLSEGKNLWLFLWQTGFLIICIISFILGGFIENSFLSLILFSLLGSLAYIINIFLSIYSIKRHE